MDLANPDNSRYGFLNTNWESFRIDREVFGIWGYEDTISGNMNALGFVFKDTSCTGKFAREVGDSFTWTSIAPGASVTSTSDAAVTGE